MSQVVFITRGLPGSGKSTFALQWIAEKPDSRARVNRDDIRFATFGKYVLDGAEEKIVTRIENELIHILLKAGKSIIIDNMNLRDKYVKGYLAIAAQYGVPVLHRDFPVELKEAIRRDAARDRNVGEAVITKLHRNFIRKGSFSPFPTLEDESAGQPEAYVPDTSKPAAVLLDVDGTAMNMGDRGPFEWHNVLLDTPNTPVIEAVKAFQAAGLRIVVMSGRDIVCKDDTILQLEEAGVVIDNIFMRANKDGRKDSIIKGELFDQHVRHNYNIVFALDDRLQVVRFYRDVLKLPVFQVADGNF